MSRDINILLGAILDDDTKAISKLNNQIKTLESKLKKVKLEIELDDKISKSLSNLSKQTNKLGVNKGLTGDILGINDAFKDLTNVTEKQIIESLKLNKALKDQEIVTASLDRVSGKFSVTTKNNQNHQNTLKGQIDKTNGSIHKQADIMQDISSRTLSFSDQMKIAAERTVIWTSVMTALYGSLRAVQAMTQEIILLDSSMTELMRVFEATPNTYNEMLDEAIGLSQELGNNIHDVMKSLNEAARTFGEFNTFQLMDVAKTATIASNVSDLNPEEAMNSLIGTMNAFKIAASESIGIVNRMNEVDNSYAVSTKQLAESLSRSASVAKVYGATLEENIGHTTAIASVTMESGTIIGRSLKTIYSRITTMDKAKDALEAIGISINDMSGNVKPVSQIIEELASRWSSLSKAQQQVTAVEIGGREHLTRLVALLENYETAISATETALHSEGSATRENEKYVLSLEARINKLKNSFTSLSSTIGENGLTSVLKASINILTFSANGFEEFTEATKGLNITLPILAGLIYGVSKAVTVLSASLKGAKLSLGWIGAAIVGIELLGTVIAGTNKVSAETVDKFIDSANSYNDTANQLENLISKHNELKPKANESTKSQEEYEKVLSEINKIAPHVIEKTDEYGNSLEINKDKADKFIESLRTMNDEQLKRAEIKLDLDLTNTLNDLDEAERKLNASNEKFADTYKIIEEYKDKYNVNTLSQAANEYQERMKNLSGNALRDAANEYAQFHQILTRNDVELEKHAKLMGEVDELNATVKSLEERKQRVQGLTNNYQELNKVISSAFEGNISKEIYGSFDKPQLDALIEFGNKIKDNKDNIEKYTPILKNAGIEQEKIDEIVKSSTNSMTLLNDEIIDQIDNVEGANKVYQDAIDSISSINKYLEEYQENNHLSADSINSIIQEYPDLIQYLYDEAVLIDQLKIKKHEETKVAKQALADQLLANEQFFNSKIAGNVELIKRLNEYYGVELKNFKSLAEAKGQVESKLISELSNKWSQYYDTQAKTLTSAGVNFLEKFGGTEVGREFSNKMVQLENLSSNLKNEFSKVALQGISLDFNEIGISNKSPSNKSGGSNNNRNSSKKDEPDFIDTIEAEIRAINNQNDLIENQNEKLKERLDKTKDYNTQLKLTNQLIEGQKKEITSLRDANIKISEKADSIRRNSGFNTSNWFDLNGELTKSYYDQYNKSSKSTQESMKETANKLQLLKKVYYENQESIKDLVSTNKDLVDSLDEINKNIIDEVIEKFEKLTAGASRSISKVNKEIELLDENSENYFSDYAKLSQEINKHLEYKQSLIQKEIDYLESQNKLSDEQLVKLSELRLVHMDVGIEIKNNTNNIKKQADSLVDEFKKAYEKRKDIVIKTIEAEMDAEDKRHEKVIKELDEQVKAYENVANAKLKTLDREQNDKDYETDLAKLQKKRQSLQQRIDVLSLDNSIETTAKKMELQQELAEVDLDLEAMKDNRKRELRKRQINDDMDAYKKDMDAKKDVEDTKYKAEKDRLDKLKRDTENYYKSLFDNEAFWTNRRNELINGNIENLKTKLEEFLGDYESKNEEVTNNLKKNWEDLITLIEKESGTEYPSNVDADNNSTNNQSSDQEIINKMRENSLAWNETTDANERKKYAEANQSLGKSIGATYKADGTWWKDNERLYHSGGVVGGTTSRLGQLIDKLFNTNSNEIITKSLKGEVQIPPNNFANGLRNMQNMLVGNKQQTQQSVSVTIDSFMKDVTITKDVNPDVLTKQVFDKFASVLRTHGIQLR